MSEELSLKDSPGRQALFQQLQASDIYMPPVGVKAEAMAGKLQATDAQKTTVHLNLN